ncbi:DnaJ protein, putative [Plasmodium relictum]|uniref:DnaJ protein, putative n=1 Tax=Plasmodium relictum TaxID=85471 RepID=A0A1J1H3V2_PLARL|nr:DnaJ protein, putative [Plasmodium relictum]CRG99580.1 DnaJ protein, putative [Plasmodium relictum]
MKKKTNIENFDFKKNEFICNNSLSKSSNYFNVNKIKELYNIENNKIYEQIFDTYYTKGNVLKKRKKEKIHRKNSLSPSLNNTDKANEILFHINEESITPPPSLHSTLHTKCCKTFKNNNENKNSTNLSFNKKIIPNEEFYFYNNNFDNTPKKIIKDNINLQEKSFVKISKENYNFNSKSKNALINRNSLNKYDFIRFVCSPNKKRSNEKSISNNNEVSIPIKDINKKKENFNENLCKDTFNSNDTNNNLDMQKNINRNNNTGINQIYYDKEISEKSEDNNAGIKVKPKNFIEPYNSFSINSLSKNFFINNKKFFINDINKDKIITDDNEDDLSTKNIVNEKNDYVNLDNKDNINRKKNLDYKNTKMNNINYDFKNFDNNTPYHFNGNYAFDDNIYDKKDNNENSYLKDINIYLKKNYKIWKSLYSYLDVSYNCSKEEIKKSYKDKIKVHHPDKGGSIKEFLELKLSYDILINDKKRKLYDKYGNGILELLISEKFSDYNISSDEKNEEEIIDDECLRIYDLFVLKYKNISYLHNLYDLKINSNQYNEFQKLIYHFFNIENNIFKNIFYIYPIFSPHISPFIKNKKKNNSENSFIYFDEISNENSHETTSDNSPLNIKLTNEITTFDTKKKKNITNIFNDLNSEFDHFFKNYIMEKIELSEKHRRKCNKSYENKKNEHKTVFKENIDSYFEKDTFISSDVDPQYNNYVDGKGKKNFYENSSSEFFKDIQLSPVAYRIINDDSKKHVDDFYKWFEFFFEDNLSEVESKEEDTTDENEDESLEKKLHKNIHNVNKNIKSDNFDEIEQNIKKKEFINNLAEKLIQKNEMEKIIKEKLKEDTFIKNNNIVTNNCNSSINNTNKLVQFYNPINNSLNHNCKIKNNIQSEFLEKNFNKNYDDILNIEEKYGFNLIKKSEHKVNDLTHDFNYIYIGNNINKKKNFILFIKEECVKKFLKIKLLINKVKKKSNLKHISLFESEIDKNLKNIEYILLLITYKEELVPLNDFYLLDKNIYSEDYYCIPLYIKKNNIIRPHFCHFKWIVYTLQSLFFFNLYFKKVNKYICTFPFFNYKYNCLKKYLENKEDNKNYDKIKDKYIFFQHYIIKNKHKYLKYFPHCLFLYLKDVVSLNRNCQKQLQVNLSPVFVLTPNKLF